MTHDREEVIGEVLLSLRGKLKDRLTPDELKELVEALVKELRKQPKAP